MSTAAYYRTEARRCRELAARSPVTDMVRRWLQLAAEYETLADTLDNVAPAPPLRMQPQPMQQQQSKAEPEDKT
jgi:hypothetical protein